MIFNQIAMQGPFGDPAGDKRRMEKKLYQPLTNASCLTRVQPVKVLTYGIIVSFGSGFAGAKGEFVATIF